MVRKREEEGGKGERGKGKGERGKKGGRKGVQCDGAGWNDGLGWWCLRISSLVSRWWTGNTSESNGYPGSGPSC